MKYFIFLIILFVSLYSPGQLRTDSVRYKDGNDQLEMFLYRSIFKLNAMDMEITREKKFFSYNITIDKNGEIKRMSICSFEESAKVLGIFQVVMKTSGNWINKTAEDQIVNLTFCFETLKTDDRKYLPSFNTYSFYFESGQIKKSTISSLYFGKLILERIS